MQIIQIFVIVFLLIMLAGFIAAFSDKGRKEQRGQEPPRVIVTQRVPSVHSRRDHRR